MKRKGADCDRCPLRDKPFVPSEIPDEGARIALVGEAPGEEEERTGHPFVGPAGGWLMGALSEARIHRAGCFVGNVLGCRPPDNDIASMEGEEAIKHCAPGLTRELESFPGIIVALGNTAFHALTGMTEGITKARGSIYEVNGVPLIPTYHPSGIMRSQEKTPIRGERLSSHILRPVWVSDLVKARDIADHGWTPPKENFLCFPTLTEAITRLESMRESRRLLAVDIETIGWNPDSGEIVVIGLAEDSENAISIPLLKQGGGNYWTDIEWQRVFCSLRGVLAECPTVFQNAKFDMNWLKEKGLPIGNLAHDTMLLHHVVSPELPHDLGFIVSIYGRTPYWKGEILGRDRHILDVPDTTLRIYNLRDSVVLHQVLKGLLEDLEELGPQARGVYRNISIPLIGPILAMERRGMLISTSRLARFKEDLKNQLIVLEAQAMRCGGVPSGFNLQSDEDMRLLLYGVMGPKYQKAIEELPKKKKTNTRVFAELARVVNVAQGTESFDLLRYLGRNKTKSGKASVAEPALLALVRQIASRLELIQKFRRPTPEHLEERDSLERAREFLATLMKFNERSKLLSTYTDYPVKDDGRVHPSFLIHGANTGRLCVDPNTWVEVPRDLKKNAKGIRLKDLHIGDLVYSFDEDRELCLRKVSWVGPTLIKPTLIIRADKGDSLIVSREHLIRKYGGVWVHAKDVKKGDRLLCMPKRGDHDGYSQFFPHSRNKRNHRVLSIENGPTLQLWDLEVEETHCFIGNDVALHNSCKEPNLQNQPDEVRDVFVAGPGKVLVSADYSNLELRVLAYVSHDVVLQDVFTRGLNVHDENTKALFGITDQHPHWKILRRAAKVYIFGRNYGGSVEGIFEKVCQQVPEAGLSLARFKAVDAAYRSMHPEYARWYDEIRAVVLRERRLTNAFGRTRTFFGNDTDIVKEGLNFPVQSAAADVINSATIALHAKGAPIICQIHDQLLFEVDEGEDLKAFAGMVREEMERRFEIDGRHVSFPVDISSGRSWGSLTEAL